MRLLRLAGLAAGLVAISVSAAEAAPGYATANVNLRTGPDTDFPSVGVIPDNDPVEIIGCLQDQSWCDVSWADNRGWVFSEYLGFEYQGREALVPDYALAVGIPVVAFAATEYWNRYYVGRPWYAERNRWEAFAPRPRPGWRPPPPGSIPPPGWWRSGYQPPRDMRPPPTEPPRRPPNWNPNVWQGGPSGPNGPGRPGGLPWARR